MTLTSKLYWNEGSSGESGVGDKSRKDSFQRREIAKVLMVVLSFFSVIILYSEWKIVLNIPS